jgi:DNA modification methylase
LYGWGERTPTKSSETGILEGRNANTPAKPGALWGAAPKRSPGAYSNVREDASIEATNQKPVSEVFRKPFWCGDTTQSDVWNFAKNDSNPLHPTMKPAGLIERAIKNSSQKGDLVLDPFGGSGTTLIAAEHLNRKAFLIEIEPQYVDVTIQRWQNLTGKQAVLERTGEKFDDLQGAISC